MANFVNLPASVGINDPVIVLRRVTLAEVFIVTGTAGPDGLRIRRGCSEVQPLLVVDNCRRITIDAVPRIARPLVAGLVSTDNVLRDTRNHISGCSQPVTGDGSDPHNAKATMQVFPLHAGIIIAGSAPAIPRHTFGV